MKLIEQQLALYEEEYKKFMGTNQFPKYELQFNEVSLNVADNYGFNSVAFAAYKLKQINIRLLSVQILNYLNM